MKKIPWWQNAVIYQIYPRSFQDTTGDGTGDIKGIIKRLDYLEDLGIDALWISPIFPSPMKDFGYDISNYCGIDPLFGSMKDFKELLKKAHRKKIRILLDLVINHTSDEHPWFIESRSSLDNPKRDWYIWKEPKKKGIFKVPNNWICQFEVRSAWFKDKITNQYYMSTFTKHQPEVNWRNKKLKKAMYDVIKFWFDLGIDGFRMDVANWYLKDPEFKSNPWSIKAGSLDFFQKHIYDRNQKETLDICKEIRQIADSYKDKVLVGEIYIDDPVTAVAYGSENRLHMSFNFNFLFQKWSSRAFFKSIDDYYNLLPDDAWPNFNLSNHDQKRHFFRYLKKGDEDKRARIAASMILTLKGTPFLYYGEEIAMSNGKIRGKDIQDPLGKSISFMGRDSYRTPMQWNVSKNAGFSDSKPWLPLNADYKEKNVEIQSEETDSILHWYKNLIKLRKNTPTLQQGDFIFLLEEHKDLLAYKRKLNNQEIVIILNFSAKQSHMPNTGISGKILMGTHRPEGSEAILPAFIHPYEVLIIETH